MHPLVGFLRRKQILHKHDQISLSPAKCNQIILPKEYSKFMKRLMPRPLILHPNFLHHEKLSPEREKFLAPNPTSEFPTGRKYQKIFKAIVRNMIQKYQEIKFMN